MPYSDFTLEKIQERFGVDNRLDKLFRDVPLHPASERLKNDLDETKQYLLRSEKAKSEWIVVPILRELKRLNNSFLTIHSGENLEADPANGLNGECDFILAKDIHSYSISFPILQVVEAKKQDFDNGIPQCAAQLIGADLFNKKRNVSLAKIYGCVTTGVNWKFLVYQQNVIYIDTDLYTLDNIDQLLGIFQYIVDYYKTVLP